MRYWDTSAIVPLLVDELGTDLARGWLEDDPSVATWGMSRLELVSAVERRVREGRLGRKERLELLRRLSRIAAGLHEVTDLLSVRTRAASLLARHPLRAADAAQLAAALLVSEGDAGSLTFVSLDRDLALAAEKEGFPVLTWPSG